MIGLPSPFPPRFCRACGAALHREVIDFGAMPISNSLLDSNEIGAGETFYPLRVLACDACHLVQLADSPPAEVHFHANYLYFSSFSRSWLAHCEAFAAGAIARFGLEPGALVLEIASNDGYLLTFFRDRGFATLGIEPSASVAEAARAKGIDTEIRFFGRDTAADLKARGIAPSLIIANNVFAHVPDLSDFVEGFAVLLDERTVLTAEVHYFRALFDGVQFDSFYHEHYAYYTIRAAQRLFARHGLRLFDVELLPTHGGSLRFYVCREDADFADGPQLASHLAEDDAAFARMVEGLDAFRERVFTVGEDLRRFLADARRAGLTVAGFGAPAKATTLLNFARITRNELACTVDSNPAKQGRFIPGVHIPIHAPAMLETATPDYVLILPWNLRDELAGTLSHLREKGTQFVCAVPSLEVF